LGISSYLPSDSKSRAAEATFGASVAGEVAPIKNKICTLQHQTKQQTEITTQQTKTTKSNP